MELSRSKVSSNAEYSSLPSEELSKGCFNFDCRGDLATAGGGNLPGKEAALDIGVTFACGISSLSGSEDDLTARRADETGATVCNFPD